MPMSSTLFVTVLLGVWASGLALLSRYRSRSVSLGGDAHRAASRPTRSRNSSDHTSSDHNKAGRTRGERRWGDRGASALEWAVISAILVTAAVIIGGVIYNVVSNKSDDIQACGSLGASAESCEQ